MVSWREELDRREAEAVEQAQRLRDRIDELTAELGVCEQRLSRFQITRETMAELVGEAGGTDEPDEPTDPDHTGDRAKPGESWRVSAARSPIGVIVVPQRTPGADPETVLPGDYCQILRVLAEHPGGVRAGHVAGVLGIGADQRSKVEAMRSKLKRLAERGWADRQPSGMFTLAR